MKVKFNIILFLLLTANCWSVPDDHTKPITFESNSAYFNKAKKLGIYRKNVKINQGTSNLTATIVYTYLDHNNKLTKAIANGDNKHQAHFWTVPKSDQDTLYAYADTIELYPEKHLVVLIGNASLKQKQNTCKANRIEYNMDKQTVYTPKNKNSQIEIILDKESKKDKT